MRNAVIVCKIVQNLLMIVSNLNWHRLEIHHFLFQDYFWMIRLQFGSISTLLDLQSILLDQSIPLCFVPFIFLLPFIWTGDCGPMAYSLKIFPAQLIKGQANWVAIKWQTLSWIFYLSM